MRYKQDVNSGEWLKYNDITKTWEPDDRKSAGRFDFSRGFHFMKDLEQHYGAPIVSPIDGEHITSRSQLREHERKHNVRQCGDYRNGEIVAHETRRVERIREKGRQGATFRWT